MLRSALPVVLAAVALGCAAEEATTDVIVEVKTDYVPQVEFDRVRTRIFRAGSGDAEREIDFPSDPVLDSSAYGAGVRVAEANGLPGGRLTVEVELSIGEERTAIRRAHVNAAGPTALTVPLTRSCANVTCDGEVLSACLAGRCVTSDCADGVGDCGFETLPLADYPRAFVTAACARLRACAGGGFDVTFEGFDCVETITPTFEDTVVQQVFAALERGTLSYDPSRARACTEAVRTVSCEAPFLSLDLGECYDAFSPVAGTEQCHLDLECGRNSYCETAAGCPGTCASRVGRGDPCTDDAVCQFGLSCRGPEGAETCVPTAEEGEPCGLDRGVCSADHTCVGARPLLGEPGRCWAVEEAFSGREGDACNFLEGPYCAPGLTCAQTMFEEGTCVPHPVASGGTCRSSVPDMCPTGEYCATGGLAMPEGTCEVLPRDGEPCLAAALSIRCAAGHRCVEGVCHVGGRLGDACATDDDCVSRVCSGTVCVAPECVTRPGS